MKEQEARQLEKQYGKKKAREVAEMKFQERIEQFEQQEFEEERAKELLLKKNLQR